MNLISAYLMKLKGLTGWSWFKYGESNCVCFIWLGNAVGYVPTKWKPNTLAISFGSRRTVPLWSRVHSLVSLNPPDGMRELMISQVVFFGVYHRWFACYWFVHKPSCNIVMFYFQIALHWLERSKKHTLYTNYINCSLWIRGKRMVTFNIGLCDVVFLSLFKLNYNYSSFI